MRSFAVWYKKNTDDKNIDTNTSGTTSNEVKADIHVNLWETKICKTDDSSVCIDFGVMVYDMSQVLELCVYCPFPVTKNDIRDLGDCIIQNTSLVGAIFNEDYQICTGVPRRITVSNRNNNHFIIYALDINNDLTLENIPQEEHNSSHGTILSFDFKNLLQGDYGTDTKGQKKYYFRFRVRVNLSELRLMFQENNNISPLQDAFVITQVIDFRLNNLRSCNQMIRDRFAKDEKFDIQSVHYLLLRRATDVFIHQGEHVSSRLLEQVLWKKYIEELNENVIAYHFKAKTKEVGKIADFCILTRFEYHQINWLRVLCYIYIVIFLSVIAGLITAALQGNEFCAIIIGFIILLIAIYYLKK